MPDGFAGAAALLPERLRRSAEAFSRGEREQTEEFRLRAGRLPTALLGEEERPLGETPVTESELRSVVTAASGGSYHAVSDELRKGYLAAPGGIRVGVCGTAVTEGAITALRDISSVSLRIPRQLRSAGAAAIAELEGASVLVLSPPGAGKTTFLRELVRTVSDGGTRVGLADERGELAAAYHGAPQFDVGRCTDVLTGAPKAEAAMLLLRSMNPQVIALDELSAPEDAAAALHVAGCGVRIFATLHADSLAAVRRKPLCRELLAAEIFEKAVIITRERERKYRVETL